jgi:hypothetical protein
MIVVHETRLDPLHALLLSGEDREIARRAREIKTKTVKPLTRAETFKL